MTPRSGDGGGDRRIGCEGHRPPPSSGGKQKTQSPVSGDNNDDAAIHDDDGGNDARPGGGGGEGDQLLQFDGICRSRICVLVAGRRQSHLVVNNSNAPAGWHEGVDNNAVPPPPRD